MGTVAIDLDEAQREAASIPLEGRQIVLAGPGAGKTEVVAALAARLIDDEGIDAEGEILIISFSRAAVEAVGRRVRDDVGRSGVSVTTLDALAARVLHDQTSIEWESLSFDDRIRRAQQEIRKNGFPEGDGLGHVIIDEVQDIVGDRALLVATILGALPEDVGFTLLGDPAQAIYDFQTGDGMSMDASQLLDAVRALGAVHTVELRGQYRAKTRDALGAAALRADLLAGEGADAVDDFGASVVPIGSWEQVAAFLPRWTGTTAILTRTNGEALLVSDELARYGVATTLREPSAAQPIAPWVAETLGRSRTRSISRDEFLDKWVPEGPHDAVEDVWLSLRGLVRARTPMIEIPELAARLLRDGRAPAALATATVPGTPVVSTVHRAKGLEFDDVVVVRRRAREDDDPQVEARTGYVAYTRARARLVTAPGLSPWELRRDERTRRWVLTGKQSRRTRGFEIRGTDFDRSEPPGGDREQTQARIAALAPGVQLTLVLDPRRSLAFPVYDALAGDVVVGRTSARFGADLISRVGGLEKRSRGVFAWPVLTGARVGSIETVAGPTQVAGAGRWGLWLGVRPVGMLSLRWKGDADE